jgi:hypothetical protein
MYVWLSVQGDFIDLEFFIQDMGNLGWDVLVSTLEGAGAVADWLQSTAHGTAEQGDAQRNLSGRDLIDGIERMAMQQRLAIARTQACQIQFIHESAAELF